MHGPYDPAIFYGKKDVPFSQVDPRFVVIKVENIFYRKYDLLSFKFMEWVKFLGNEFFCSIGNEKNKRKVKGIELLNLYLVYKKACL